MEDERNEPKGKAELDRGDEEVFAALEAVREQYEGYLAVQESLSLVLDDEPDALAAPGWDHPLGVVIHE